MPLWLIQTAGGMAGLVILLWMVTKRKPTMQLSDETNALLAHAFALKEEAVSQDDDVAMTQAELAVNEKAVEESMAELERERTEAIEAHRDSNDAAIDAIKAVAVELGIELPL